jgi:hypothetical protein
MRNKPGLGEETPWEAAAYIAQLSSGLSSIARRHQLDTLIYLLDMARMEAENLARLQEEAE